MTTTTKPRPHATIDGHTPEEYAGLWGSTEADGVLFYNFSSERNERTAEYLDGFTAAIERMIAAVEMTPANFSPGDADHLRKLLEHVQFLRLEPTYSVIYSFDIFPGGLSVSYYRPNIRAKRNGNPIWQQTEGDNQYEGTGDDDEKGGKHRKYCAILTESELVDFLNAQSLNYDGDGSSLGAPGFGFGMSPAMVFSGYGNDVRQDINVTPIPHDATPRPKSRKASDELWAHLKSRLLRLVR